MRLSVQGWRGINHSYAMVNQYQLLELRRRSGIALFHEDLPFHEPQWNTVTNAAGFGAEDAAAIAAIPPPDFSSSEGAADIAYRIAYPYRAHGGAETRIFCQITCEYRRLIDTAPFFPASQGPAVDARVRFITPSHWSKQGLVNSGLAAEKIHVVPHGVDPAIFHPPAPGARDEMRRRLKIAPGRFVFLNVGAMSDNKGIDMLLRAFAQVRRHHPDALLLLKDLKRLYNVSARAVVEEVRRTWPEVTMSLVPGSVGVLDGNLDLKQLAALYAAADAYVSPYRAEAFNLPPLEAAACGVPIAVTAGGATDEYVHESFALPIASHNAARGDQEFLEPELDSLVDVMLRLIEGRAPQLNAREGIRRIGETLTWKHAVDALLAAFAA